MPTLSSYNIFYCYLSDITLYTVYIVYITIYYNFIYRHNFRLQEIMPLLCQISASLLFKEYPLSS